MPGLSKLSDDGRVGLKALASRLITAAGGVENATPVVRVNGSALSKYQSTAEPFADHFMPLDVVASLTLDTVERAGPIVARHFAAMTGHAVVALPRPLAGEGHRALAETARETGDVLAAAATALADGRIDSGESKAIIAECDQAIEALLRLKALAEAAS